MNPNAKTRTVKEIVNSITSALSKNINENRKNGGTAQETQYKTNEKEVSDAVTKALNIRQNTGNGGTWQETEYNKDAQNVANNVKNFVNLTQNKGTNGTWQETQYANDAKNKSDSVKNKFEILGNVETKGRDAFGSDAEYERYLVENDYNLSRGKALDYVKDKAQQQGTSAQEYAKNLRNTVSNTLDTEKLQEEAKNGNIKQEDLDKINQFGVLVDENGNEVDLDKYNSSINLYKVTADNINNEIEELNAKYNKGEITYEQLQDAYANLQRRWEDNQIAGEQLNKYKTLQGFDYYDWAKANGKDVSDFEKYAESFNDSMVERLAETYSASVIDAINTPVQAYELLKTIATRNTDNPYDFTDENSLSSQLTAQSQELQEYAFNGVDGFQEWSLQTVSSLMPMVHATIGGMALGGAVGATGEALTSATSTIANVTLGTQTAGQVTRQRIEEGSDLTSAVVNGVVHGTITALVEGLDAGKTASLFTGDAEKILTDMMLSTQLAGKASYANIFKYINAIGTSEGAEEIIEALADKLADELQNAISSGLNGVTSMNLTGVEAETLDPEELANQFIMAYAGAVIMGIPTEIKTTAFVINSNKKYNSAMSAKSWANSVLSSQLSPQVERDMAIEMIRTIDSETQAYKENSVTADAVAFAKDVPPTLPSYDECMQNLTNAVRQDVQGELKTAQETLEKAQQVKSQFAQELSNRGYDISIDDYLSLNDKTKHETKVAMNVGKVAGWGVKVVTNLPKGSNGMYLGNKNIVIDATQKPVLSTLVHEITHGEENTSFYEVLDRLASQQYGSEEEAEKEIKRIQKIYNDFGNAQKAKGVKSFANFQELTFEDARKEFVAKETEKLLGNEEFVKELIQGDKSLAQKIFDMFNGIESDELSEIKDTFKKAFEEASQIEATQKQQFSIYSQNVLDKAKAKYNESLKNGVVDTELKQTIDKMESSLEQAQSDLFKKSEEQILKETGWFLDDNYEWNYEDTNNVKEISSEFEEIINKYNLKNITKEGLVCSTDVKSLMPNDNYIKLLKGSNSKVEIIYDKAMEADGYLGTYFPSTNTIVLYVSPAFGSDAYTLALLHEVQHSIQTKLKKKTQKIQSSDAKDEIEYIKKSGYNGKNKLVLEELAYDFYIDKRNERQAREASKRQFGERNKLPNYSERLDEETRQYWIRRVQRADVQSFSEEQLQKLGDRILDAGTSRRNISSVEKWIHAIANIGNDKNNVKVQHSIDTEYAQAVKDNDLTTAQNLVDEVASESMPNSEARDEDGNMLHLYHSSPSAQFYTFDKSKANPESNLGGGFYFTNKEYDANDNYHEGGADIENRIDLLAERLQYEDDSLDYEQAKEKAREQVVQGEGTDFDVYLNITNPVYINGKNDTQIVSYDNALDLAEGRVDRSDYEDDFEYEDAVYQNYVELITDDLYDLLSNRDIEKLQSALYQALYDGRGSFEELRSQFSPYEFSNEEGTQWVTTEVIRRLVETQGYDGIIDSTVSSKFKRMGLDPDTTHYVVFNENQIKSADAVTYDDDGNVIPLSERFNPNKQDIRWSIDTDERTFPNDASKKIYDKLPSEFKDRFNEVELLPFEDRDMGKYIVSLKDGYVFDDGERGTTLPVNSIKEAINVIKNETIKLEENVEEETKEVEPTKVETKVEAPLEKAYKESFLPKGEQRKGTKENNDVNIKAKTENGKTALFARTMAESSQNFNKKAIANLEKGVEEGTFSYQTQTNKELVEKVKEELAKEIKSSASEASVIDNWLADENRFNSQHLAKGEVLVSELLKARNYENAERVASKLALDYVEAGRAVQSARIFKTLSPTGRLQVFENDVRKINERLKRAGRKATAEISKETKQEYIKALNEGNEAEIEKVEKKLKKEITDSVPPTIMDKLNAWRYIAMLGNFKTIERNVIGNTLSYGMSSIKDAVKQTYEMAYNSTHKEKIDRTVSMLGKSDKANVKFAKEDFAEYSKNQKDSSKYKKDTFGIERDSAFNSKVLRSVESAVDWLMNNGHFGDTAFVKERYAVVLAQYMKANSLDENVDKNSAVFKKGQELAWKEAERTAFHEVNKLARKLNQLGKGSKIAEFIKDSNMPYTTTPLNVARQGINYSPIGMIYHAINDFKYLKNGVDADGNSYTMNDYLDYIAQGTTGTSIFLIGALLHKLGKLRTKDDDKDRLQDYQEDIYGEQNYSIVLGENGSYTIDWATPLILPLALGAEFDSLFEGKVSWDTLASLSSTILDPLSETTMLSSLQSTLKSYGNKDAGDYFSAVIGAMLENHALQTVPTMLGQIKRAIDNTRYTTYPSDSELEVFAKKIENKSGIPVSKLFGDGIQPYIDANGNVAKNLDNDNIFVRFAYQLASPGYYSKNKSTKYDDEMMRLYNESGEADAIPSTKTSEVTIDKQTYKLTGDDYTNVNQNKLKEASDLVKDFMDSDQYQNLTDEQRIDVIAKIRKYTLMEATSEYAEDKGLKYEKTEYEKARGALDKGVDLYDYYLTKDYYSNLSEKNGDVPQSDYLAYLNASDMSADEKQYMYAMEYGSSKVYSYIEDLGYDSEVKLDIYDILANTESDKDSSGNTISNSKATKIKQKYIELGVYDDIVKYIQDNDLKYTTFGLSKTVVEGSSSTKKSSSSTGTKSSLSTAYSNAFKSSSSTKSSETNTSSSNLNSFKKAYSSVYNSSSSKGSGYNYVTCPNCHSRVIPINNRCPVCGNNL